VKKRAWKHENPVKENGEEKVERNANMERAQVCVAHERRSAKSKAEFGVCLKCSMGKSDTNC
jgi:hypothetical protein